MSENTPKQISTTDFERKVFEKEEVRIVIQAPAGTKVDDYDYQRKEAANSSVSEWLDRRVRPLIGELGVVLIDGRGVTPHGRMKIENVRSSYARD